MPLPPSHGDINRLGTQFIKTWRVSQMTVKIAHIKAMKADRDKIHNDIPIVDTNPISSQPMLLYTFRPVIDIVFGRYRVPPSLVTTVEIPETRKAHVNQNEITKDLHLNPPLT